MSLENKTYEAYSGNNQKNLRFHGFAKTFVTCFLCFLGFVVILKFSPSSEHSNKETSVRGSVSISSQEENIVEKKAISGEEDLDEQKGNEAILRAEENLENAELEVEEAEGDAFEEAEESLKEVLSDVEVTLKKTLSQLIENQMDYSTEEAEKVKKEVVERLEGDVIDRLEYEAESIKEDAKEDMETVFENDVGSNLDAARIESDVNVMREYFIDGTKRNIERAGEKIQQNIRDIVTEIEKEVITEKLGETTTSKELEDAELITKVVDATDKIDEEESEALSELKYNINKKATDKVKNVLSDFLRNEKGLVSDDITSIEEEVSDQLQKEVNANFQKITDGIQEEISENTKMELDTIIEEDKFLINRAKQLGFTSSSKKDVDLIEKDLDNKKKDLQLYAKEVNSAVTQELLNSIDTIVKNVEKNVLEEKGVEITEEELDNFDQDRSE